MSNDLRAKILLKLPDGLRQDFAAFEAAVRAEERAELAAANERNAALQTAAIDYWNASVVASEAGRRASEALLSLLDADNVAPEPPPKRRRTARTGRNSANGTTLTL